MPLQRRPALVWGFLFGLLVVFVVLARLAAYYLDWLWFGDLGYRGVFWRTLGWRLGIGLAGAVVTGGIIFFNLWLAARDGFYIPPQFLPYTGRWLRPRGLVLLFLGLAAVTGLMGGLALAGEWTRFALFLHRQDFGVRDPLFGRDVGFYVFTFPALSAGVQFLGAILVLGGFLAAALYALGGRITGDGRTLQIHHRARLHLFSLLGVFLLVKAAGYALAGYRLLYSPRGVAFGASYTDVHVSLPGLRALAALAVVAAGLAFWSAFGRRERFLAGGLAGLLLLSFLLGNVAPGIVQEFVVRPNEISKEERYIRHNIDFTRRAYGLDRVVEREFPAGRSLTPAELPAQRGTLDNVRLWDWRVLLLSYQQLQGIRPYYRFKDVDVDRYPVDGLLRQVLISGREIEYGELPERTWVNQHLKYTHGYGIVLSPAASLTPEGQPDLWIRNIPPERKAGVAATLTVTEPRIYFGELTEPYVIVNTREPEFDYPQGDENKYTSYRAARGVPIGSFLPRLAFATVSGDYNVLFTRAIKPDSRLLLHRRISTRVQRVAPFLLYDGDPYLVLSGGRLFWLLDAYTVTPYYPYSEPTRTGDGVFNYVRNSVKVTVDAYDGSVTFYLADPGDPLIRAYAALFPGLFRPLAEMPPDLRAHIRYPEDLFVVQMEMYAKYHMRDPVVFYNKEDLWQRPQEKRTGGEAQPMEPYYVIMQLPGEERPEFLLMSPLAPARRQNMIAWLAARSDGDRYGELLVYKFPKQRLVYGPEQVEALIEQNDAIAEKFRLWEGRLERGNLLVIPIKDSILYVKPIYLKATGTGLPELRRVVVGYGDRVVMENTFPAALEASLGAPPGAAGPGAGAGGPATGEAGAAGPAEGTAPAEETLRRAALLYRQATEAMRRGDWAAYGRFLQELGDLLGAVAPGP